MREFGRRTDHFAGNAGHAEQCAKHLSRLSDDYAYDLQNLIFDKPEQVRRIALVYLLSAAAVVSLLLSFLYPLLLLLFLAVFAANMYIHYSNKLNISIYASAVKQLTLALRTARHLAAEEVPLYLSRLKSEAYPAPLSGRDILLTADTVVVLDGEVLGKPRDREDAAGMLRRLSGRRHTVVSGVTLRTAGRMHSFEARTSVWFRPLADEEIAYYVDAFRPFDKAGSYGIQEWIGYAAIERIEGSFYNVMGLPIQKVYVELTRFLNE